MQHSYSLGMENTKLPSARGLEDKAFLLLIAAATALFAWIVAPFYGAVLWAVVIAVLFVPLHRRMRRSLAAPLWSAAG